LSSRTGLNDAAINTSARVQGGKFPKVRLFACAEGFRSPAASADQHCVRRRSWEQQAKTLGLTSRALFTLTCANTQAAFNSYRDVCSPRLTR